MGLLSGLVLSTTARSALAAGQFEVVSEWVTVDYEWKDAQQRAEAIASGEFVPENNPVTGVKICGPGVSERCPEEMVFVSVPRLRLGVPATLNQVVRNASGADVLRPWPSKAVQDTSDCRNLQNVQSMEVDSDGIMWVLDVGRKYFASSNPADLDNHCHPKVVHIDIATGEILDHYTFPEHVAPPDGAFLNDLVIDVPRQVAYISSTGNNATDLGSLVVYDRKAKKSRRFQHDSTHAEPNATVVIHGTDFSEEFLGFPIDGIALHPAGESLYYSALNGLHLYSLSAAMLRNFSLESSHVAESVVFHGLKPSNSDGMTFGGDGDLFFSGLQTDAYYRWTPGTPLSESKVVAQDSKLLWFPDTFGWDNMGNIWATTNRLNTWFFGGMDFEGNNGPNFRLVKSKVATTSYMKPTSSMKLQSKSNPDEPLPPAPWQFSGWASVLQMNVPVELAKSAVPEPFTIVTETLRPKITQGAIYHAHYLEGAVGEYQELGISVATVKANGEQGAHQLVMFVDSELALRGGRELWGINKSMAKFDTDQSDDWHNVTVTTPDGIVQLRASFSKEVTVPMPRITVHPATLSVGLDSEREGHVLKTIADQKYGIQTVGQHNVEVGAGSVLEPFLNGGAEITRALHFPNGEFTMNAAEDLDAEAKVALV